MLILYAELNGPPTVMSAKLRRKWRAAAAMRPQVQRATNRGKKTSTSARADPGRQTVGGADGGAKRSSGAIALASVGVMIADCVPDRTSHGAIETLGDVHLARSRNSQHHPLAVLGWQRIASTRAYLDDPLHLGLAAREAWQPDLDGASRNPRARSRRQRRGVQPRDERGRLGAWLAFSETIAGNQPKPPRGGGVELGEPHAPLDGARHECLPLRTPCTLALHLERLGPGAECGIVRSQREGQLDIHSTLLRQHCKVTHGRRTLRRESRRQGGPDEAVAPRPRPGAVVCPDVRAVLSGGEEICRKDLDGRRCLIEEDRAADCGSRREHDRIEVGRADGQPPYRD
eukprot:scaffold93294_cov27-Tisochrysis_lutea.AAC.4